MARRRSEAPGGPSLSLKWLPTLRELETLVATCTEGGSSACWEEVQRAGPGWRADGRDLE